MRAPLFCLLLAGCAASPLEREPRPHVVLISVDTLHVDWTGPYNPAVTTTPFLNRFASEGARFARAYTQVPITLPAHASLMTGVSPQTLGVFANGDEVPASARALAEILGDAGYRSAAFPSLGVLRPSFGLEQGFDHYDDPFTDGPRRWYRTSDEVLTRVSAWVTENAEPDQSLFLWVHLSDPHEPYLPVGALPDTDLFLDGRRLGSFSLVSGERYDYRLSLPPGRHRLRFTSLREARPDDRPETAIVLQLSPSESLERAAGASLAGVHPLRPDFEMVVENAEPDTIEVQLLFSGVLERPTPADVLPHYETEVTYTDAHLAKLDALFDSLGIAEETLFVIVSDHGEGLFHHDFLGHTTHVYEDQLRVVWMMRGPGVPPDTVLDQAAARLTDVAPTLLDLLGLDVEANNERFEGRSWAECLSGGGCPQDEPFWAFGLEHHPRQLTTMAAFDGDYKWIWQRALGRSAYDLANDPREANDLLSDGGPDNPEPLKRLAESFPDARRELNDSIRVKGRDRRESENEEMLESLGYISRRK